MEGHTTVKSYLEPEVKNLAVFTGRKCGDGEESVLSSVKHLVANLENF